MPGGLNRPAFFMLTELQVVELWVAGFFVACLVVWGFTSR